MIILSFLYGWNGLLFNTREKSYIVFGTRIVETKFAFFYLIVDSIHVIIHEYVDLSISFMKLLDAQY